MATTYKELMDEARQIVPEVTIDEVINAMGPRNAPVGRHRCGRRF